MLLRWSLSCVLTLCNPVDSSPPGSSVYGIPQTRILEWVAISFSRGSSQPRSPALQADSLPTELRWKPLYTHIYVYILLLFFSIMTYHRTLNIVPCAVQSDLIVYSIYDSWCLLIRTPSPSLSHPSCPLVTTSLFSVTVSLSVSLVCSLVF